MSIRTGADIFAVHHNYCRDKLVNEKDAIFFVYQQDLRPAAASGNIGAFAQKRSSPQPPS